MPTTIAIPAARTFDCQITRFGDRRYVCPALKAHWDLRSMHSDLRFALAPYLDALRPGRVLQWSFAVQRSDMGMTTQRTFIAAADPESSDAPYGVPGSDTFRYDRTDIHHLFLEDLQRIDDLCCGLGMSGGGGHQLTIRFSLEEPPLPVTRWYEYGVAEGDRWIVGEPHTEYEARSMTRDQITDELRAGGFQHLSSDAIDPSTYALTRFQPVVGSNMPYRRDFLAVGTDDPEVLRDLYTRAGLLP